MKTKMTEQELTQLADDLQRFTDEHLVNGLENYWEQFTNTQLVVLVARNRINRHQLKLEVV